jgi:hypothetical protein
MKPSDLSGGFSIFWQVFFGTFPSACPALGSTFVTAGV